MGKPIDMFIDRGIEKLSSQAKGTQSMTDELQHRSLPMTVGSRFPRKGGFHRTFIRCSSNTSFLDKKDNHNGIDIHLLSPKTPLDRFRTAQTAKLSTIPFPPIPQKSSRQEAES